MAVNAVSGSSSGVETAGSVASADLYQKKNKDVQQQPQNQPPVFANYNQGNQGGFIA